MFNNTSIKSRLIFVLVLLSGLLLAIGLMGLISLANANAALKTVYEDRLVAVSLLDQVIRSINRTQLAITEGSNQEPARLPELASTVESELVLTGKAWNDYIATYLDPEEKILVAKFDLANKSLLDNGVNQVILASRNQDVKRVQDLIHGPMKTEYQVVRGILDSLIKLQIKVGKNQYEQSQNAYMRLRLVFAMLLAVGLTVAAMVGIWLIRSITHPVNYALQIAQAVAAGDLTRDVLVTSNNETGMLLQAMKEMTGSLERIVGEVRSGTDTISSASSQIAAGNLDLSSRTEQQASSLQETASSMEELTSTVKQNYENAVQANQLAVSASEVAQKGGEVVTDVIVKMASINESARKIVDIISVIDGIAFQTNILALNAAVEAARAGEQGRGFAVVATEVRNLAHRSASAAKEIKVLINDSVDKVDAGSKLVDQAGITMQEVVDSVKRVSDIVSEITSASQEQSTGIEQINHAITEMDNVTQQNASLVEEAAAAARAMQDQATNLAHVVSTFKTHALHTGQLLTRPSVARHGQNSPKYLPGGQ